LTPTVHHHQHDSDSHVGCLSKPPLVRSKPSYPILISRLRKNQRHKLLFCQKRKNGVSEFRADSDKQSKSNLVRVYASNKLHRVRDFSSRGVASVFTRQGQDMSPTIIHIIGPSESSVDPPSLPSRRQKRLSRFIRHCSLASSFALALNQTSPLVWPADWNCCLPEPRSIGLF
jgi:hypothetical protein